MSLLLFILLLFSSVSRCSYCIDLVCSAIGLEVVLIIYDYIKLCLSCSCLALYPSGSLSNCCHLIYGLELPISISRSGKLSAICWRTEASLVQRFDVSLFSHLIQQF